jgi:hypothetical protein
MKLHKDLATSSRDQLTMEQMLCQSVIGHVLSNKQPFISFAATTKQVYESFVPELANRLSFFLEVQKHFPGASLIGSECFTRPVAKFEESFYSRQKDTN